MRRFLALIVVSLVLVGCGGGSDEKSDAPAASQPASTAPAPPATTATSTTSGAESGSDGAYRKPKPGEKQVTIAGRVARGSTVNKPGEGDTSVLTAFEIQPDDGGEPVRVAAAGDLAIDPQVRAALVDPRCGGKLHGTFVVIAAGRSASEYDWELLRADVPRAACGGP